MFCLEHFYLKCIIKDFELKVNDPLNAGDWGYIVHGLEIIIVLVLLAFNHPPKVIPLTNLDEVTAQRLYYVNSNAWKWHHSYQSGVINIIDQLILHYIKKLRGVQE